MAYPSTRSSISLALVLTLLTAGMLTLTGAVTVVRVPETAAEVEGVIQLPAPSLTGEVSVEEAIASRRSIRSYADSPLTLQEFSQLLWAAQGITDPVRGFRSAPSAGATYPLTVFAAVSEGGVLGLEPGIYEYLPEHHGLRLVRRGDFSEELAKAALGQAWVREAPVCLVIAADYSRTTRVYGERGVRYVHMEAGHVGENIYLQATAMGLGTVAVGAFHDDEMAEILQAGLSPLYIFPVGRVAP